MCSQAKINGEWCETVGQVLQQLSPVVLDRGYKKPVDNSSCLCPVDMEATAERNGYRVTRDETGDWIFDKVDDATP